MQKIQQFGVNLRLFFAIVAGAFAIVAGAAEGLLLARLVARLLAARPDSPGFTLLYGLTEPLVGPLRALDYDQPPFGAALEFSTLTMAIVVPAAAYLAWLLLRAATPPAGGPS